jgi:hypothetical protein
MKTVTFRAPNGRTYEVDPALDHAVLRGLNLLPGLALYQVCAGHPRQFGYAIFKASSSRMALKYLRAGLALHYHECQVIPYRMGRTWQLEFRHENQQPGALPAVWWEHLWWGLQAVRP